MRSAFVGPIPAVAELIVAHAMQVKGRRRNVPMAQKPLHLVDRRAGIQSARGKKMAEGMG
jgi:hypothetical protein